ncbi:MAG: hypothetical protein JRH20_09290 [Deltaproteobacteria bacterium]|nr:hypothetical protein [Deltaproteobacteria bacterium]
MTQHPVEGSHSTAQEAQLEPGGDVERAQLELRRASLHLAAHEEEEGLTALKSSWEICPCTETFFTLKSQLERTNASSELKALYFDGTRRALSPSLRTSCLLYATELLNENDPEEGRVLEEALTSAGSLNFVRCQPEDARRLTASLQKLGQDSAASTILRALVQEVRDEKSFADAMELAQLEKARGDDEAAYDAHRMALRLRPASPEALAPAREYLREQQRYEPLAELLALSAAAAVPNERAASLWRELARLAEDSLADATRAIQAWRRAWELTHTGEEAGQLERLYATEEEWPQYLELLEREALRCSDLRRKIEIYREIATCQLEVLEDDQAALKSYSLLLQLAPGDRDALGARVDLLQRHLNDEAGGDYPRLTRAMERFISHCGRAPQRDAMLRRLIELQLGTNDTKELASHLQRLDPRDDNNAKFVAQCWNDALAGKPRLLSSVLGEIGLVLLDLRSWAQETSRRLPMGVELVEECVHHQRDDVADILLHHLALLAPEDEEVSKRLSEGRRAAPEYEQARYEELVKKAKASPERDRAGASRLWIGAAQIAARVESKSKRVLGLLQQAQSNCPKGARHVIALLESVYDELALHDELATFLERQLQWEPKAVEEARLRKKLSRIYGGPLARAQDAVGQLEALLELSPDDPGVLRELIDIHRELHQYPQLAHRLAAIFEQSSGDERIAALEELGAVHAKELTDERMAFHYYGQLLVLQPEHPLALAFVRGCGAQGSDGQRKVATLLAQAAESSANDEQRNRLLEEAATLAEEKLGDRDFAIAQWRRITSLDPSSVKARQELKRLLHAEARWGELEALLLSECSRVDAAEDKAKNYLELARLTRIQLGDLDTAGNHLRAAHQLAPRDAQVLAEMAVIYEALEQWRRLATVLERHAELETDKRARLGLLRKAAEVLVTRLRQEEEALAVCRRIREIAPGDAHSAALMSDIYANRDQWKNLVGLLREQIAHENIPAKLIPLHLQLGDVLLNRLTKEEMAAEQFEAVLDLAPEHDEVLPLLHEIYSRLELWDRLIRVMERRAITNSVTPALRADAFFEVGELHHHKLADETAARRAYEQALQLVAGHSKAMAALRQLAAGKGQWREVLSLARHELETLTHPPDKARLLVEIAAIMERQLERPGAAAEALREALELDTHNDEARAKLGLRAFIEKRWGEAVELLTELVDGLEVPELHEHLFRLARAHEELGAADEAFSCYVKSFSREPLYLPTLDRLLELCFVRRQWANTQRIAEAVIGSYGEEKSPHELADVYVRLGLCELHQAQQRAALRRLQAIALPKGAQPVASDAAWEDVAKSWAATPVEPLLLRDVEFKIVTRVIKAMEQALTRVPNHAGALQILAALTMSHGDWDRSLRYLERAAQSDSLSNDHQARLQVTAGDVAWSQLLSRQRGQDYYRRALELAPDSTLAKQRLAAIKGNFPSPARRATTEEPRLLAEEDLEDETQELLTLDE